MTRIIYILCLVFKQCAFAGNILLHLSQPDISVSVQPGYNATFKCYAPKDGLFKIFWFKFQNCSTPVLVAMAQSEKTEIILGETFQNPSKYRLTWNNYSFNLSVLYVELTDIAVYYCGTILYNRMYFGNGTTLVFEEHFNGTERTQEKEDKWGEQIVFYAVLILVTITVVSILLNIILFYILRKYRTGMSHGTTHGSQKQKIEELDYAAITFAHNQRKTKQRLREDRDIWVTYEPYLPR